MGCINSSTGGGKNGKNDGIGKLIEVTPNASTEEGYATTGQNGNGKVRKTLTSNIADELRENNAMDHMEEALNLNRKKPSKAERMSKANLTLLRKSLEPNTTFDNSSGKEEMHYKKRVNAWRQAFSKYSKTSGHTEGMTFKEIFTMFFEEGLGSRVEALVWFNKADDDGNKYVTWEEFEAAMADTLTSKENIMREAFKCARRAKFLEEFSKYDVDGSGGVTLKEMKKIFKEEGKGKAEAMDIFSRFDKSGDGVVSFDEYVVGMEEMLKEEEDLKVLTKSDKKMAYYFTLFKYFDSDHSGSITYAELKDSFVKTNTEGYQEIFQELEESAHHHVITASGFIKMLTEGDAHLVNTCAQVGRALAKMEGNEVLDEPPAEGTAEPVATS